MDKVTHFEIPIKDPNSTIEFYKNIFGWKIQKWDGSMPYWMVSTVETNKNMMPKEAGAINGGFTEDIKYPLVVISVQNIEETAGLIKSNKGKIVQEKRKVGDMGWYARFKDPDGNIIGIWQDIKK